MKKVSNWLIAKLIKSMGIVTLLFYYQLCDRYIDREYRNVISIITSSLDMLWKCQECRFSLQLLFLFLDHLQVEYIWIHSLSVY